MSANLFTEALESRTLLSASPASVVLSQTVREDRLQVQMDLLKFKSDFLGNCATMLADVTAVRADHPRDVATLRPLIAKFRADQKAMWAQLKVDRLTEAQNVLKDESVIVGDQLKILQDKGHATAESADHAKRLADRIKLQNDMIAGLTARLTTRQTDFTKLGTDLDAIVTAAQSDPNASPQLVSDLQKFAADKTTCLNTITADIQTLIADRTTLAADLTAMQSA